MCVILTMEYSKQGVPGKLINTQVASANLGEVTEFEGQRIQSAYFSTCGDTIGIQAPEGRSIVITDVIHGATGGTTGDSTDLELCYKDSKTSLSSARVVFLVMPARTTHTFFTPILVPAGKFVNFRAGADLTLCYYIV